VNGGSTECHVIQRTDNSGDVYGQEEDEREGKRRVMKGHVRPHRTVFYITG
jgi:hypothetical protein